jgi:hypothetical protein
MIRRLTLTLLTLFAAPAAAQGPYWNPAAEYITAGQDEPGYRVWVAQASWRPVYVKAFHDYLVTYGVGGVAPTWQLLRTATDWQKCNAQPFEVPPTSAWPNIVAALRYVGQYVVPAVGPVEVVSVYRIPTLNACAGGAPESTHRTMGAVDMVPLRPVTREMLITQLCAVHQSSGERNYVGLGLYKGLRFHIDARKYREWGMAGARGGFGCGAVLAERPVPYRPDSAPTVAVAPASADPLAPQR